MINPNSNQNQKIIFPEENSLIISELLEKYNLKESLREIFEKTRKGEKTFGNTIAKIVRKAAEEKFSFKELVSSLKTELALSPKKAEGLAKDIKKKLLVLVEKPPPEIPSPTVPEKEEEKPGGKDVYREPIE